MARPGPSRRHVLAGAGALLAAPPARAAQPAPRLRRGVGVHHVLNWPEVREERGALGYVWPAFAAPSYRMDDPKMAALKRAGFDFVRLTVDPSILIAAPAERRPALERHAHEVVARFLAAGLDVVFDLHPVAVNPAYGPQPLVDPRAPEVFAAYVEMVGRVALVLRDLPPDRVALEPFNEPWVLRLGEARRWDAMLQQLHARARQADPSRPLVLNGLQWDSAKALQALDVAPFRGSNVVYTFHYYDPHAFTHQGVEGDTRWLRGLAWPTAAGNARAVLSDALARIGKDGGLGAGARAQAVADTRDYVDALLRTLPGAAQISQDFAEVAGWATAKGIPAGRVLLGEFGCVGSADGRPLGQDRLRWLRGVRTAGEAAGFGWAYWAYKGHGGMELVRADGVLDPDTLDALGLAKERP